MNDNGLGVNRTMVIHWETSIDASNVAQNPLLDVTNRLNSLFYKSNFVGEAIYACHHLMNYSSLLYPLSKASTKPDDKLH